MVIQYFGLGQVKVSVGDTTLLFAPYSKEGGTKAGLKTGAMGSNIALLPINHSNYNGGDQASYGDKKAFIIDGPGEYEIGGVFVKGLKSLGLDNKINTIYSVLFEDINICHIGAMTENKLEPEVKEALGAIDVLFVPTYGDASDGVLNESDAHKLASKQNAKIVVPLYFAGPKVKGGDTIKTYLKESGESNGKPLDKFTFKKKDIIEKQGEVVVISSW